MDPRIGTLIRKGQTIYYAFVNGYDQPQFEGTLDEVEVALGIRDAVINPLPPEPVPVRPKVNFHTYEVTVTPKIESYAGHHHDREYVTEFIARNAAEAIKYARAERNENEGTGRYVTPCKYRAKKVRDWP